MTDTALSDAALAAQVALDAGRLLRVVLEQSGLKGKALGEAGDAAANRLICDAIRAARPDDGLLSEEERDNPARLDKSRVWIIDPVDGTREYGEGRVDWAVHVALAIDGVPVTGAVGLPGLPGEVVLRSDQPAPLPALASTPRFLVSRSRPAAEAEAVAAALGGKLVPMGSAGAKAMAVVRGEAEVYLHSGGQHEWDSCAPVAVARAHGLHCSRIDGSPLVYNRPNTFMPDLLICRPELAEVVLTQVARLKD
ncbi:3'(2'),5'-bisphosphate nucleotidase CysQ [Porphyrobacter sp. HT-58-2]|uniref:3'(2'),5'-bisphosphate nucleotidase CysQ n=1 Tax=Porphyrobacter sp. HT-58-2 TaxID=2023229 RepID=UPI000CDC9C3C|nr:3'(2'),5'-bisphosphate nucleotidase CysQ [Porphyrobacter sp. HT-58-2]AUX68281.1 3'(2'),5'-bisphosphate nucleotidase CysQ [Porphyrobacter sp. HT-58-2]